MHRGEVSPFVYRPLSEVRRPVWLRWLPLPALAISGVAEYFIPERVGLTFLVAIAPLLATVACGPVRTALWSVASSLVAAWLFEQDSAISGIGLAGHNELLVIMGIGVVSVLISAARARYDVRLTRVGTIAEVVQYAVLSHLPEQVGNVQCAALYRSAQRDAMVGGDLFDVRVTEHGVRAIIGDVKGHGLEAVSTMAALLGAFREASLDVADLVGVAERLERRLTLDNSDRDAELFATALLIGFPPGGGAELVVCGHPPPFLVHAGTVRSLAAGPGPPLGFGGLVPVRPRVVRVGMEPGDTLIACTDGVLEARDASGRFYPLEDRLRLLTLGVAPPLSRITSGIWEDLGRFAEHLEDDVAILALRLAAS